MAESGGGGEAPLLFVGGEGLGLGFRVWGKGFGVRAWGEGLRVWSLGFRVWGEGFRAWSLGVRMEFYKDYYEGMLLLIDCSEPRNSELLNQKPSAPGFKPQTPRVQTGCLCRHSRSRG